MILRLATPKEKLIALVAILAIIASAIWIGVTQFTTPDYNMPLHQAVGEVLAEETYRALGHNGSVVIVSMETRNAPELKVQMEAYEKQLKLMGEIKVKDRLILEPGDNPKYRPGSGLSAKRFLKIIRKNAGADAIVSFVGAPQLPDAELAQIQSCPKFIAEAHSPERFVNLLDKKILQAAVVPRYDFPAPGPKKPATGRQWFDHYFQIVRPESPPPKPDALP
ncbi:MAG TPA: hypothetical protein VH598_02995 [Verrucomicrobiae bacterium]|nr:hypothetical protein [Verrucomicrobiae bacterium]